MKHLSLLLILTLTTIITFGQQINSTIERVSLQSAILNDDRAYSVYLPPSYYSSNQNYPVLYILDGDYNFFYVSGMLELQSAISENIPEMILIGISGKGTDTYRENCKPNIEKIKDKGNADLYAEFIEKELIPHVNKNYKTASYKILAGHSVGGLFIINTVLNKPYLFDNYIAISPSLWWEKYAINEIAIQKFKSNPDFHSNVYLSLANEQGMGVDEFLDITKEYNIQDNVFKFNKFPNENHNSVGLPSYIWALKDIFRTWKGDKEYFDTSSDFSQYLKTVNKQYGSVFNLQPTLLAYTIFILRAQAGELDKMQKEIKKYIPYALADFDHAWAIRLLRRGENPLAEKVLEASIEAHPSYFDNYNELAKVKMGKGELKKAEELIKQGIKLAINQKARQWKLNELIETEEKIKAAKHSLK